MTIGQTFSGIILLWFSALTAHAQVNLDGVIARHKPAEQKFAAAGDGSSWLRYADSTALKELGGEVHFLHQFLDYATHLSWLNYQDSATADALAIIHRHRAYFYKGHWQYGQARDYYLTALHHYQVCGRDDYRTYHYAKAPLAQIYTRLGENTRAEQLYAQGEDWLLFSPSIKRRLFVQRKKIIITIAR